MTSERKHIWSFGGGVQSVAILVLIAQGRLSKPERVIMADTGRESSLTWDYTNAYTIPLMQKLGMELEIASHELANNDLYSGNGDLLIPAYSANGKLPTFCSSKWKREVFRRYLRAHGYGQKNPVTVWFGMSLDEVGRMRSSDVKWIEHYYPLCFDVKLRRHECLLEIERFGLPTPPKSACWMCPHRNNSEWAQQKRDAPADFDKAIELDSLIRANDERHEFTCMRHASRWDKWTLTASREKRLTILARIFVGRRAAGDKTPAAVRGARRRYWETSTTIIAQRRGIDYEQK